MTDGPAAGTVGGMFVLADTALPAGFSLPGAVAAALARLAGARS